MKKNLPNHVAVSPMPVLIIATYDENGKPNAMNVAWGNQSGDNHLSINLSNGHKTTANIRLKHAFTAALATEDTLEISDFFGIASGHKTDKIDKAGIMTEKAPNVDAPILCCYPLTMECRVVNIRDEFGETRIDAEVVNTIVDESVLDAKGKVDFAKMKLISFDQEQLTYRSIGDNVGKAFSAGKSLK